MSERKGVITFKGNPLTLVGNEVKVGEKAPDVALWATDLAEKKLSAFLGHVTVISAVPSLDTPVCNLETKRFNDEAIRLGKNVKIITISRDTPFAQKRWAESEAVGNVTLLSDFKHADFGQAWGVLIKELSLLARVVFVLDKAGKVQYVQTVKEVADEPDYEAILKKVKELA